MFIPDFIPLILVTIQVTKMNPTVMREDTGSLRSNFCGNTSNGAEVFIDICGCLLTSDLDLIKCMKTSSLHVLRLVILLDVFPLSYLYYLPSGPVLESISKVVD